MKDIDKFTINPQYFKLQKTANTTVTTVTFTQQTFSVL